jgi:hypothetical protein
VAEQIAQAHLVIQVAGEAVLLQPDLPAQRLLEEMEALGLHQQLQDLP